MNTIINRLSELPINESVFSIDDITVSSKYYNSISINGGVSFPGMVIAISLNGDTDINNRVGNTDTGNTFPANDYVESLGNGLFRIILAVPGISNGYIGNKLSTANIPKMAQLAFIE